MSYKERLEIIKKYLIESIKDGFLVGTTEAALNTERVYGDIKWLVEQAEKAEKYREALEFYADENIYSARNKERAEITLDYGEKARQALEG